MSNGSQYQSKSVLESVHNAIHPDGKISDDEIWRIIRGVARDEKISQEELNDLRSLAESSHKISLHGRQTLKHFSSNVEAAFFVSPLRKLSVRNDMHGMGHFGAPRNHRKHAGVDYSTIIGEPVRSPIFGKVAKVNAPQPAFKGAVGFGNKHHKYVSIVGYTMVRKGPEYVARPIAFQILYVVPSVKEGDEVQPGSVIGHADNLEKNPSYRTKPDDRRGAMSPHIHVQCIEGGKVIDPNAYFKAPNSGKAVPYFPPR